MIINLLSGLYCDHEGPYSVHNKKIKIENKRISFRQGDLDGACGPYALMTALMISGAVKSRNEIEKLWSEKLLDQRTKWHKELVRADGSPRLISGTHEEDLQKILEAAKKALKLKDPIYGKTLEKRQSFRDNLKNESLITAVIDHLKKEDLPVILMIDWNKNTRHWVTVVGYQIYENNQEDSIKNTDALLVLDPSEDRPKLCAWNGVLEAERTPNSKYPFNYLTRDRSSKCKITGSLALFFQ